MGKGSMTDIVSQSDGFDQVQVQVQRATDGPGDSGHQLHMQAPPGHIVIFHQGKHLGLIGITVIEGMMQNFEEKLGLQTDKSKSYEERRERIKAKKRGNGTTTIKMIKDTALAFDCGEIDITEVYNDYIFKIKFF